MSVHTAKAVLLILLLWCAGLAGAAQFAKVGVPMAQFADAYPQAGAGLGWLLSIISLLGAVFGMTAGVFVSRIGYARALIGALVLGAALSLWQASLPPLRWMLASRVLEGASHLMIVVAAPTLIAQVAPDRLRGAAMALWSTFFGVAFALVAWLGVPLMAARGLAALLWAHGLLCLLVAVGLWAGFALVKPDLPRAAPAGHRPSLLAQHLAAYRSARIAAPAYGWVFYTLTFVSLLAILPGLLQEAERAPVAGAMPLVSIVVALGLVAPLLRHVSAVALTIAGFGMAVGVLGLAMTGLLPLGAARIVLFAVLGLVQGGSFAAIPDLNTPMEDRALANGAMAQMGNLGNMLGTPLLLAVLGMGGQGAMLGTVALFYLAGAGAHWVLARARARAQTG